MTIGKNRIRLAVEHLEDRSTPSAMAGGLADQFPARHSGPHAAVSSVGATHYSAVPIRVTTNCFVGISSMTVRSTGFGTGGLGHYTALGHIDNTVIDLVADRAEYSGTFTVVTANGDLVFLSFTTSWQLSPGKGRIQSPSPAVRAGSPAPNRARAGRRFASLPRVLRGEFPCFDGTIKAL